MQGLAVNERWQRDMAPFFEALEANADESMGAIEEVFPPRLTGSVASKQKQIPTG